MTPGVNRLPPVGLMFFSEGAGGAAVLDGDVVVVVVVVEGACWPPVPHPAVTATTATTTVPPARAISLRRKRFEAIINLLCVSLPVAVAVDPGRLSRCRWRLHLGCEQVATIRVEVFLCR